MKVHFDYNPEKTAIAILPCLMLFRGDIGSEIVFVWLNFGLSISFPKAHKTYTYED